MQEPEGSDGLSILLVPAYELFRKFQHMQPDMDSINDAIGEYYWDSWHKVFQITSQISLARPNSLREVLVSDLNALQGHQLSLWQERPGCQ